MSVQLNPRDVLSHLNSMGYRNISADQLKEFMKDLKRLITYESRYSLRSPNVTSVDPTVLINKNKIQDHFEKLYKTSTEATKARASSRLKNVAKENKDPYDPYKFDRIHIDEQNNNCRKNPSKGSKMQGENKHKTNQLLPSSNDCENAPRRSQQIRVCSASSSSYCVRNTPTDLYQNYQREWSRIKHLLPGEHPRFIERQVIRKRMETIQKPHPKPKVYIQMYGDNKKEIRREAQDMH